MLILTHHIRRNIFSNLSVHLPSFNFLINELVRRQYESLNCHVPPKKTSLKKNFSSVSFGWTRLIGHKTNLGNDKHCAYAINVDVHIKWITRKQRADLNDRWNVCYHPLSPHSRNTFTVPKSLHTSPRAPLHSTNNRDTGAAAVTPNFVLRLWALFYLKFIWHAQQFWFHSST